jgi:hypothetical protein
MESKPRTLQQNKALHKYFVLVADELNAAGLDIRKVYKPEVEIPWTGGTVKEYLWKTVQRVMLEKEHTSDLETKEIDAVYDVVNRHLAKLGVHVPFPANDPPPPDSPTSLTP